jgi:hypothetical protein
MRAQTETRIDHAACRTRRPRVAYAGGRMTDADDPELVALLESYAELLEAATRLTVLSERLLHHARPQLTAADADDARQIAVLKSVNSHKIRIESRSDSADERGGL